MSPKRAQNAQPLDLRDSLASRSQAPAHPPFSATEDAGGVFASGIQELPARCRDVADRLRQSPALLWAPGVQQAFATFAEHLAFTAAERQEHRECLRHVVEAFVQGVMGLGWKLKPPAARS